MVGGPARYAVVEVLSRMRKADEWEDREQNLTDDQDGHPTGLFGRYERKMFQDEILQQVVIGIGKLDAGEEEQDVLQGEEGMQQADESMSIKHNRASKTEIEGDIDEQAAVGRLSSMSLMAAVTAAGVLGFHCRR
jgi:hypothetical protein